MLGRWIGTGLMVNVLVWSSGCMMPAAPIDLIKPPLSVEHSHHDDLSVVLQELLPAGARIVSSTNVERSNGITYGDVDGDGVDEAVVVYEMTVMGNRTLKAALLKRHQDEWRIVWDVKGFGDGLHDVEISDINGDDLTEIVLGWTLGDEGRGIDIYQWNNRALKLLDKKGLLMDPIEKGISEGAL